MLAVGYRWLAVNLVLPRQRKEIKGWETFHFKFCFDWSLGKQATYQILQLNVTGLKRANLYCICTADKLITLNICRPTSQLDVLNEYLKLRLFYNNTSKLDKIKLSVFYTGVALLNLSQMWSSSLIYVQDKNFLLLLLMLWEYLLKLASPPKN